MHYQKILPPPYLQNHVRYFWILESLEAEAGKTFSTIADGLPGLIFQQSARGDFFQQGKQLPALFLYGQTTKYTEICSPPVFRSIGIYFYPHALKALFGFDAFELTNTCISLDLSAKIQGSGVAEQLKNTLSANEQVAVLSAYLYQEFRKNSIREDRAITYAQAQITQSNGNLSLPELRRQLRLSERSFERKFSQHIGISAQLFLKICRFQASLNQLRTNNFNKLADIAYANNYADQSHFIRVFKEFTGLSPLKYYKHSRETVINFPEVAP